LSDGQKTWLPYTQNQHVVFQNDAGLTDTLRVTWLADTVVSAVYNKKCTSVTEQRVMKLSLYNHPGETHGFTLQEDALTVTKGTGSATFRCGFDTPSSGNEALDLALLPVDVINDSIYHDVLYIADEQSPIRTLRYAREHGLLQYTDINDVIWNKQ
jgi:hypothetical protein